MGAGYRSVLRENLVQLISSSIYFVFLITKLLQYDGINDDLDCWIDFKYLIFICIIKYLRSRVIKGCLIE